MEISEVKKSKNDLTKEEFCKYIDTTVFTNEIKEKIKVMFGGVLSSGENDINIDLDDLNVILENCNIAYVGTGESEEEDSAIKALKLAVYNASLDVSTIHNTTGVLIHFEIHPDFSILEISHAIEVVYENVHSEADIIWGTTTDELISEQYVKASILFTKYEKKQL